VTTNWRTRSVEKEELMKHLNCLSIFSPKGSAWKAVVGVLIVLISTAAASAVAPAHGTAVDEMKAPSSVLDAEAEESKNLSSPPEQLYGTWTAKDVDAKMGEVRIRLTFRQEKNATLLAWSDIFLVGQVRDLKESFSVHGNTISSEAIRDGKEANFSFENDQLVLRFKSGKVVRFNRE
jgi:hypothetical protein